MDHAGKAEVRAAINEWSNKWKGVLELEHVGSEGVAYMERAIRHSPYSIRVAFCVMRIAGYLFQETYGEAFLQPRPETDIRRHDAYKEPMDKHTARAWDQAINKAEAEVYTLDNRYLTLNQKTEVERWYQFPGACAVLVFLVLAVASVGTTISWRMVIGVPLAINAVVGFLNWYLYPRRLVYVCYLSLCHPWVHTLMALVVAAYLFYAKAYMLGAIALVAPLGLLSIAEPHMWLYAFFSRRHGMHPKYAFFKRFYNITFPFEKTDQEDVT